MMLFAPAPTARPFLSPSSYFSSSFSSSFSSTPFPFNKPSIPLLFPITPVTLRRKPSSISSSSNQSESGSAFTSEQSILDAVADFDDSKETSLPAVRTFENDLVRLTLVAAVDFQQALTAAASDGGEAADEHLSSGVPAMVVETIFPGPVDDRSTVATRLFLPARKVKEKAVKLKRSLKKDILQNISSKNILAMTFRQVVLQQLWTLELALFRPGTERDMDDLENPREVPVSLTLTSSDERVISNIGEVVCRAALENTERHFLHGSMKSGPNKFFSWFSKGSEISSRDSSVVLYNLLENEILANAKTLLEKFNLERSRGKRKGNKLKNSLWKAPVFSKLEKIGGLEFCAWISECVPSYLLTIDAGKFSDLKFEGWKNSELNSWEVFLTHSQMVCLSDILDMYYEDVFTLPNKRLSFSAAAKPSNLACHKGSSLLKILSIVLASGIFIVAISVLRKLCLPNLPNRNVYIEENAQLQSCDVSYTPVHSEESSKVEASCVSIIGKIKDTFGWPGEIKIQSGDTAWVGELPTYLRKMDHIDSEVLYASSTPILSRENGEDMKALENIASYQVVLSTDGNVIGFQPANRVAVNNWAANPLAKDLYGGKHLSPGLLEPGLKISHPSGVVVLELLMSTNPDSYFALVRAADLTGKS